MSDPATVTVTPVASPIKSGWLTSEHLLSLLAIVLGALLASNVIPADSTALRIAGVASTVLAALGYTYQRTQLKLAAA